MSKNLFDFGAQLHAGNEGESDFLKLYKDKGPTKSEDRKIDFFLKDGSTVELKTDTYPMEATANFFMELYSDVNTGKIGGPWRALQDGVKYFVYYFTKNRTFFWFETVKLCEALEEIVIRRHLTLKRVRNKSWITEGYAVPRHELEAIILQKDIF